MRFWYEQLSLAVWSCFTFSLSCDSIVARDRRFVIKSSSNRYYVARFIGSRLKGPSRGKGVEATGGGGKKYATNMMPFCIMELLWEYLHDTILGSCKRLYHDDTCRYVRVCVSIASGRWLSLSNVSRKPIRDAGLRRKFTRWVWEEEGEV